LWQTKIAVVIGRMETNASRAGEPIIAVLAGRTPAVVANPNPQSLTLFFGLSSY